MNREEMWIRQGMENYDTKIDDCLDVVLNLINTTIQRIQRLNKRLLVRSFPKSCIFKIMSDYRTTKLNEAVEILCKTDKGLGQKKGGKKTELSVSSLRVDPKGVEPPTF